MAQLESSRAVPEELREFPQALMAEQVVETPYSNRDGINRRLLLVKPDDFVVSEGLKTDKEHGEVTLANFERQKLQLVSQVLNHPRLQDLIDQGKVTVALVKPHVQKGRSAESDTVVANTILREEIRSPLRVVFALPTHMTPNDVRYFYDSIYDVLSKKPDPETSGKSSVWDRHADYMTSGAVTMVLLYSEEGNAVDEWRRQLGPTNPEKDPKGETIRGRFGWDIRGNVGHGSNDDTPEGKVAAVKYEVGWMRGKLDKLLSEGSNPDAFMSEAGLRGNEVLEDGEIFVAVEKFMPTQKISAIGCSFTSYIVSLINKSGQFEHRRILVKSFDNAETKDVNRASALTEVQRVQLFQHLLKEFTPNVFKKASPARSAKVNSVTLDSRGNPAVVREYIHSNNEVAYNMAHNISFPAMSRVNFIDGLIFAAALLDETGVKSKNLAENFLYDGSQWVYIGGSSVEIGLPTVNPVKTGLADLLQWFGDDEQISKEIRSRYTKYARSVAGKKQLVDRERKGKE